MRRIVGLVMIGLAVMVAVAGCAMTATSQQMQTLQTKSQQIPMGFAQDAVDSGACRELSVHQ